MNQLELFPEKQIIVFLRFIVIAGSVKLNVQGPGLEIDSYWNSWNDIVVCFPNLAENVARARASEEKWDYWSQISNWTYRTGFYRS